MSSEFDQQFDFELEDFGEGAPDFDDLEFDEDDVLIRTAVLKKQNMLALLSIKSATGGAAICRVDPREQHPAIQLYDDPSAALEWFTKSLRTSKVNGWSVVYDGLPLQG